MLPFLPVLSLASALTQHAYWHPSTLPPHAPLLLTFWSCQFSASSWFILCSTIYPHLLPNSCPCNFFLLFPPNLSITPFSPFLSHPFSYSLCSLATNSRCNENWRQMHLLPNSFQLFYSSQFFSALLLPNMDNNSLEEQLEKKAGRERPGNSMHVFYSPVNTYKIIFLVV